jgi:uncharacterized protein DUF3768
MLSGREPGTSTNTHYGDNHVHADGHGWHSRAQRRTSTTPARRRSRITTGIAELGAEAVKRLVKTIAVFDDFCEANDPHQEHDFGVFEFEGTRVAFKIDYYDKSLTFHSPNPADPSVTERIITIMRADEY